MRKSKKETGIQSEILLYLRGNIRKDVKGIGGWWLNFHGGSVYMPRGIPDIVGCYKGRFIAFEVKRFGEKPTAIQRHTIKTLKNCGAIIEVVYSVNDVKSIMERL